MLNPATMVFMGFVLGWGWVVLRIVVGAILVFGVAELASRFVPEKDVPEEAHEAVDEAEGQDLESGHVVADYFRALWQLGRGLLPEYLVILLVLGAARAWLFPHMNASVGHSVLMMFGLAVTGTIFVIPTAGEIPIVQTLMKFGMGPGPAGVLMSTLPAVSLPSLVMVGRAIPARVLAVVALCVAILGILSGLAAMTVGL